MRDTGLELKAVCEAWQATSLDLQACARRFLAILGWEVPLPFSPGDGVASTGAVPFLLRAQSGDTVAALFLRPGKLEPPLGLTDRGLDFCKMTRLLVNSVRTLNLRYLLISDMNSSYLYDLTEDSLLLFADTPQEFRDELAVAMRRESVERGSLGELRRPPRSVMSRQLREWRLFWVKQFVTRTQCDASSAHLLIDRILVVRYILANKVFRRTRGHFQKRFSDLTRASWGGQADRAGEQLSTLFHDMWFDWRIDLFEPDTDLERALGQHELVARLLVDASLLSQGKLDTATILESFNYGDPQEKLRVRMVPDANEDREHYLATQSLSSVDDARVVVDLKEEGYRAIFFWFDRVVSVYERLTSVYESQQQAAPVQDEGFDLFAWSVVDAERPDACADVLAHACTHGFGILCGDATQYQISRLLFTMHLVKRYAERNHAVERFPSFEAIFEERPEVMRVDQVLNKRGGNRMQVPRPE
jgi:hypothetical protein